jgi:hypothetical protein
MSVVNRRSFTRCQQQEFYEAVSKKCFCQYSAAGVLISVVSRRRFSQVSAAQVLGGCHQQEVFVICQQLPSVSNKSCRQLSAADVVGSYQQQSM